MKGLPRTLVLFLEAALTPNQSLAQAKPQIPKASQACRMGPPHATQTLKAAKHAEWDLVMLIV